jgi:hypothetical protein
MKRAVLIASFAVAGCAATGPVYRYTRTARAEPPAKQPTCDFQVAGAPDTSGSYVEVGVLDGVDRVYIQTISDFKREVQNQVCAAGGDLVVTEINGWGTYVRGVVFKKTDKMTATSQQ